MHFKKLTIVSDTALYEKDGSYYGFNPVVREIEEIEHYFDEIIWIGFKREDKVGDLSMQKINSPKIKMVLLKTVGGKDIFSFLNIILNYPLMLLVIYKNIKSADVIHTRAPSHPALIGVLLSFWFRNKIWWNKFAGNWAQVNPPKSYGFQRWLFKKANHTNVTINGFWPNQLKHCHSFENPCLTQEDIRLGKQIAATKTFDGSYIFSFVGRLEDAKGVSRIIEGLRAIPDDKIKEVHFVGNGDKMEHYKSETSFLGDKVVFHGFLDKKGVHTILAKSHFFLLPSTASEGFPKVIAEAACYGTIPAVSDVSSISHYINSDNGFLWKVQSTVSYTEVLQNAINSHPDVLKHLSERSLTLAELFTFDNYKQKLQRLVFL